MTIQQERFVHFIEKHGHEVHWDEVHGNISALDVWTYRDDLGVQHVGEEWTAIAPSWGAIRDWLGY